MRPALHLDRTNLVVNLLTAHRLGGLVVGAEGKPLQGQEVGERDDCAVIRVPEVCLVQLEHIPPHLRIGVQGPLAMLVVLRQGIREWVRHVELGLVPREQRQDEDVLCHSSREDVHAQLVAGLEDRQELGERVRVPRGLRGVQPELMVAGGVEDTPELRLQGGKRADECILGVTDVASDYQHVLLELEVINPVCPLLIDLVVKVYVRDAVHLGRTLRPLQVGPETVTHALPGRKRAPKGQHAKACLPPPQRRVVVRLQP
mmetsp:Transcript_58845/g.189232  ORF Transcript_58845/g.189232 Transcript_58845/m.189232 type:complete len:259 (-) Transcript_58845:328-1104(-)